MTLQLKLFLVSAILILLLWYLKRPKNIVLSINGRTLTKGEVMDLKVDGQYQVAVSEQDKFGNLEQVPFDAAPAYSVSDASMMSLQPAADGLSCLLIPSGKVGPVKVQFLGSIGGKQFAGEADLNMIPGDVAQVALAVGPAPVAAPVAPAAPAADPAVSPV